MIDTVLLRLELLEAELARLDPARDTADRVAAMARALRATAAALSSGADDSRRTAPEGATPAARRAAG